MLVSLLSTSLLWQRKQEKYFEILAIVLHQVRRGRQKRGEIACVIIYNYIDGTH
jgi:hypothetical protein